MILSFFFSRLLPWMKERCGHRDWKKDSKMQRKSQKHQNSNNAHSLLIIYFCGELLERPLRTISDCFALSEFSVSKCLNIASKLTSSFPSSTEFILRLNQSNINRTIMNNNPDYELLHQALFELSVIVLLFKTFFGRYGHSGETSACAWGFSRW